MKSHYDTLNVPRNASTDEIKKAFRRLSLETHPDVTENACSEKFKQISNAASVLTNEKKRRAYDIKLESSNIFGSSFHPRHGAAANHSNARRAARPEASSSSMQMIYRIYRPRNLILFPAAFFATVSAIQYFTGTEHKPRINHHSDEKKLVQAWKHPKTGEYHTPAPWDKEYRRLKPTLEYVPRENVRLSTR